MSSDSSLGQRKQSSGIIIAACIFLAANCSGIAQAESGGYARLVKSLRPIAYWRLGESHGEIARDSVGHHHGCYECGVRLGLDGAIDSDPDTAAGFDGVDDRVHVPHDKDFELANGTVAFWFNATDPQRRGGLFSKDANGYGDGGHFTVVLERCMVTVRLQSKSKSYVLSAGGVKPSSWHHVSVTFGCDGLKLYLDGQLAGSDDFRGGLAAGPKERGNREPIAIGANTLASKPGSIRPPSDFFAGRIDEVAIFCRALTCEEIQMLVVADLNGNLGLPPQANSVLRTPRSGYRICWYSKTQECENDRIRKERVRH